MLLLYAFPEPLPLPRARGVQVAHAVSSLAAAGVRVDLAYVPVVGQSPLASAGFDRTDGVELLPLSRGWPAPLAYIPPFSRWHSVKLFAARLTREIDARNPDVLYVRHLKLADMFLNGRARMPMVYEAHEVFADTTTVKRRSRVAAMEQRVISGVRAVVCNTQATADRLVALYGKSAHLLVLPNGVNRPASLPAKNWDAPEKRVIYAGSFFGWKGVGDLIGAAAQLSGFHISLIGGESQQLQRIRDQLPTCGAEIELVARVPHSEVMDRLSCACIAVLPNRPEPDSAFTSPIKLFEYMAAGCAIVAADLPSIREILGAEEAEWFMAGDAKSLALALRNLASNGRVEALGALMREKSLAYTWQARAEKLKEFILASMD